MKFTKIFCYALITLFFISLYILAFAGYGYFSRKLANVTGFDRICIDNVEYLQFPSGVSVAYNLDGSIKQCKKGVIYE